MPTLVIPGAFQVSLHYTVSGQETVNVLGFKVPIGDAESVANTVHAAWTTAGGPMSKLPSTVKLNMVKATNISSLDGEIFERTATAVGGYVGAMSQLGTAAVVRIGAGTRSRSGKGRVFFGPIAQADVQADGRQLSSGAQTGYATAFNQFKTQCETDGLTWSVLSRKLLVATEVETISVAAIIGTQRRRLR